MESITQIHNVTKEELFEAINDIVENKFTAFLKSKEPENLTVKQTSKLLGVTELTIHNYIKKGILPASKIGRRIVISKADIQEALKEVKSFKYKRNV